MLLYPTSDDDPTQNLPPVQMPQGMGDLAAQDNMPDDPWSQPQDEPAPVPKSHMSVLPFSTDIYGEKYFDPMNAGVSGMAVNAARGMWDLAKVPGQVYQSTPDNPVTTDDMIVPAFQGAMALAGMGAPFAEAGAAGMAGGRLTSKTGFAPSAPKIISRANPTAEDIASIKQAAVGYGRKGWPTTDEGVFSTTPDAYAETADLVPQKSIKDLLPGPLPGEKLPLGGRVEPIMQNSDKIASGIAEDLYPMVKSGDPMLKFYHTGPIIRGIENYADMSVPEANTFMRDWAGQGAATSPRTQTPPNLRNSSYLMYERASGNPLTPERYAAEGNTPGFPLMGMHVDLADKFARGVENPWLNPKPTVFREDWSGNLRDVTGDTHNIRSTLYKLDQVAPGTVPRQWFTDDAAFAKYKSEGFGAMDPGDIKDTLGSVTRDKVSRQAEYLPMTEPWYGAAAKLGIHPAEAQSGGWFNYGPITGLQSPPKTITNLLNDQIAATARAVPGVPPQKIVNWWARGKIPLAGVGGAAVMGDLASQDNYDQQ